MLEKELQTVISQLPQEIELGLLTQSEEELAENLFFWDGYATILEHALPGKEEISSFSENHKKEIKQADLFFKQGPYKPPLTQMYLCLDRLVCMWLRKEYPWLIEKFVGG